MGKQIIINVSPSGETKIETKGYSGAACKDATRKLERALGLVQDDKPTAEFYQSTDQQQHNQQ